VGGVKDCLEALCSLVSAYFNESLVEVIEWISQRNDRMGPAKVAPMFYIGSNGE
jgi:hypothetical protein